MFDPNCSGVAHFCQAWLQAVQCQEQ